MLPRTRIVLLAAVSLTGVACGLKGPLYRPDEARNESVTPANPAETTRKKDTSGSTPRPGERNEQSAPEVAPPDPDRPVVPEPGR